jgi:hypothetical protein
MIPNSSQGHLTVHADEDDEIARTESNEHSEHGDHGEVTSNDELNGMALFLWLVFTTGTKKNQNIIMDFAEAIWFVSYVFYPYFAHVSPRRKQITWCITYVYFLRFLCFYCVSKNVNGEKA